MKRIKTYNLFESIEVNSDLIQYYFIDIIDNDTSKAFDFKITPIRPMVGKGPNRYEIVFYAKLEDYDFILSEIKNINIRLSKVGYEMESVLTSQPRYRFGDPEVRRVHWIIYIANK